ncbi:MAG: pyrroline-5-carboxylate reductase, partial [Desulfobulbaceae bacterium]|nr:pyrroline-5-carboxylate reductase [Desulfobulbaceae bacterium]
ESMEAMIAHVRSPGGTTAAAFEIFDDRNVRDIFASALTAARDRAVELAEASS